MKANKLHINIGKCCHMYFNPRKKLDRDSDTNDNFTLQIHNTIIPIVKSTKFLGVIIDDKLNWNEHITELVKKLACCTGVLNRIKDNIPTQLHKDLYHTLFESHLTYGITVWGGISHNRLLPLFRSQKKCIRILFGDKNTYLDKFKTCVRTRPFTGKDSQKLPGQFFMKEHSKPLFNSNKLLTIHNLYSYHTTTQVCGILKYRTPISLFNIFHTSQRKETLLITPHPDLVYKSNASTTWNTARRILGSQYTDFSTTYSFVKSTIKSHLFKSQAYGTKLDWIPQNYEFI